MESFIETKFNMNSEIITRLQDLTDVDFESDSAVTERAQLHSRLAQFIEDEGLSCSMDPSCITPLYVYRMWGGSIPLEEIENGLMELRKQGFLVG